MEKQGYVTRQNDEENKKIKTVEVSVVELDNIKEKALNIALNKIGGKWDEFKLGELLNELQLEDYDMDITGFSEIELQEFNLDLPEGQKKETDNEIYQPVKDPVYVVFITDGENSISDNQYAKNEIVEASKQPIFFQFIGIGNSEFQFLNDLDNMSGRFIDNANFFQCNDIGNMTDYELYEKLMNEYPQWISEAKIKQLIL